MSIVTGSTTGISPIDTNSHTVSCLGSDVLTRSERLINVLSFDEDGACHSYEVTVYIRTIPSRPSQGDIKRQLHRFRWGTLGHRFTSVRCVFCWLCLSTNTCIDGTNHASHMSARNVIWRESFFLTLNCKADRMASSWSGSGLQVSTQWSDFTCRCCFYEGDRYDELV